MINATSHGYVVVDCAGAVHGFGRCAELTDRPLPPGVAPVAMAMTPSGTGHWLLSRAGGVFSTGDARYYGSFPELGISADAVAIAASARGAGYWVLDSTGEVTAFGVVRSFDHQRSRPPSAPVAIASVRSGYGYWILHSNGEIAAFGDAEAFESQALPKRSGRAVDLAVTRDGRGLVVLTSRGAVLGYGTASEETAVGRRRFDAVAIVLTEPGHLIVTRRGAVVPSARAAFCGAVLPARHPVVAAGVT